MRLKKIIEKFSVNHIISFGEVHLEDVAIDPPFLQVKNELFHYCNVVNDASTFNEGWLSDVYQRT